jgi:hypothetical protein
MAEIVASRLGSLYRPKFALRRELCPIKALGARTRVARQARNDTNIRRDRTTL